MVEPTELLQDFGVSRIIPNDALVSIPGTHMLQEK